MRTLHPSFVAAIAGLLTLFVWAPAAEAILIGLNQGRFPVPGSIYESKNGTTFPNATIPTEILSMDLVGLPAPSNSTALPSPGETFKVDSFFDVFTELNVDGEFSVDSFFDVFFDIAVTGDSSTGRWQTEMVSMSLSGNVGGIPIEIQESPTLPSPGQHDVTDLGNGTFQVDSFFDVFFEVSVDGGPFVPAASAVRLQLTGIVPEPTSAMLLVSGILGLFVTTRRKARVK